MAALIGLFVGAFVGHMLWRDWGAALGGIAGFVIGAKLNARRKSAPGPAANAGAESAPAVPADARRGTAVPDRERTLPQRIAELEQRVASLERAARLEPARAGEATRDAGVAVAVHPSRCRQPKKPCPWKASALRRTGRPRRRFLRSGRHRARRTSPVGRAAERAVASAEREPRVGVVHRRQCADTHRRRRPVLRCRVPAQVFRRAFHVPDRAAACGGRRERVRIDRARHAPGGVASGLRAVAAGCRRRHPLPDDLCGVSALRSAARAADDRIACRGVGRDRLARRAQRFATAGGPGDRGRLSRADAGGNRRRAGPSFRLLRGAERRDLRAGLGARVARAERGRLRVHVRAGRGLGPRLLCAGALRRRAAVPRPLLRFLRDDRGPLRAARTARGEGSGRRTSGIRRPAGRLRAAGRDRPRCTIRRSVERAGPGRGLRAALRRAAPAQRAGIPAAVPRIRGARRDLRDRRDSLRVRESRDGGALGSRGRRRVLDRRPPAGGARPGVRPRRRAWRRHRVRPLRRRVATAIRFSPTHSSPAQC